MNAHRTLQILTAIPIALVAATIVVFTIEDAGLAGPRQAPAAPTAGAELKNAKGEAVGTVQLTETPAGVLVHASLSGLPPGVHAFHIHDVGQCEAPDFKSAGGHFNPGGQHHGFASPQGAHAGDLPNLYVPENGKIEVDVLARGVTLGSGPTGLFDANGASLVVHQGADDYSSDPAGNAGARIACGVIRRQ
jgi:Cu-Zn family superoxide dismutase